MYKKGEIVCFYGEKAKVLATKEDRYYDYENYGFATPAGVRKKYLGNKDYLIGILDKDGCITEKEPFSCNENELQPWTEDREGIL